MCFLKATISVLPLHFVGLLAPQDPEMGSLENACSVLGRTVEEVLVMDAWDHDGLVFPVFLEVPGPGGSGVRQNHQQPMAL
jgi:hypothetical protein